MDRPSLGKHVLHVLDLSSRSDVLQDVHAPPVVALVEQDLPARDRTEEDPVCDDVRPLDPTVEPECAVRAVPRLPVPCPDRCGLDPAAGLAVDADFAPESSFRLFRHDLSPSDTEFRRFTPGPEPENALRKAFLHLLRYRGFWGSSASIPHRQIPYSTNPAKKARVSVSTTRARRTRRRQTGQTRPIPHQPVAASRPRRAGPARARRARSRSP